MSQSQTITKAEIDALPKMIQTEFPDVWAENPTFQGAVPALQREIAKLHDAGLDVSGLVRAVISLGETEQGDKTAGEDEQGKQKSEGKHSQY